MYSIQSKLFHPVPNRVACLLAALVLILALPGHGEESASADSETNEAASGASTPAESHAREDSNADTLHTVFLRVDGMKSDDCEAYLEEALIYELPQVHEARADHETGWVRVEMDPVEDPLQVLRPATEGLCSLEIRELRTDAPEEAVAATREAVQSGP